MTTSVPEFFVEAAYSVRAHVYDDQARLVRRTPVHIDFQYSGMLVAPETLTNQDFNDPKRFNAISSADINATGAVEAQHLPVIDADGGAYVDKSRLGSKALLIAVHRGEYSMSSELRDVLGDNGINLEVFGEKAVIGGYGPVVGARVGSLVLRSKQGTFLAFDSTQEGHNHLYIQRAFSAYDHAVLLSELLRTGIVSQKWLDMTQREAASIVRTPWTKKDRLHIAS